MNRTAPSVFAAIGICLLAGSVLAQNANPQPPRKEPPLKGPAVKDGGVPGEYRSFAGGGKGGKDRMQQEIPHRQFVQAFNVLRGEKADEQLRLTDSQDSQLRAIEQGFREEMESYRKEHEGEARELLAKLPADERRKIGGFLAGQGPKRPLDGGKRGEPKADKPDGDGMQETDPKAAEGARARLRELFQGAPKPADSHAKMFAVLTDAQKPVVQKELERMKKEAQDRREPGKIERGVEKGKGDVKNRTKTGGEPLTLDDPRIPERMRERIRSLPPEQQAEALKRALERLKKRPD